LLLLMHGRQDSGLRCLAYWLEFKDDDEFAGYRFGGIGGGSAMKFLLRNSTEGLSLGRRPPLERIKSVQSE
jgi:5-methylcytosine-specific restriction enzyme B